jgi:hypothetical protein
MYCTPDIVGWVRTHYLRPVPLPILTRRHVESIKFLAALLADTILQNQEYAIQISILTSK